MSISKANSGPRRQRVERGIYRHNSASGVTYEITFSDSDGRQRWQTVAGGLKEARTARADVVAKLGAGERVTRSRMTLGEYESQWAEAQGGRVRPRTLQRYRDNLRLHVMPRLGRRKLASITTDDIAALIAHLQAKDYAPWTIRGIVVALSRVLGSAARSGLIPSNPVTKLERGERPRVERRDVPSLDKEAVGRLITKTPPKYRTLVAVSVLLGIRQSEARGLRWQDVDTQEGVIRVRSQRGRDGQLAPPKTAAAKRDVPMPPSLAKTLAAHRLASPYSTDGDYVFASDAGTPLAVRNMIRRGLEPALKAAELPKLTWHDLRHVAASLLIAEKASVGYVSRILGHATPAITLSLYAHEFAKAEHDDQTRKRMEAAFGSLL